jgi:hypothetical protein
MTDPVAFHEDLTREHAVNEASPRAFGLLFFVVFLIIGLAPLIGGGPIRWWGVGVALLFGVLAVFAPKVLAPLSGLWMRFGALLHSIVSPIIMAVLFLGAVVPTGLMLRVFGRDSLALKRDSSKTTYWIDRTPPGPEPESLRQQF